MQSRALVLLSTLALSGVGVSCPRNEEAPAKAVAEVAPKPAPPPAPKPLPAAPIAPLTADPAIPTLPPELADDGSDDVPDEPIPPPPRDTKTAAPELASVAKETWIFAEPRWKARRIGYLRAGAVVERRAEPAARNGSCPEGWYRIAPRGYVCVGAAATLNVFDPVVEASNKRPARDGLPYTYVMSRFPPPPFYARLPDAAEAIKIEPDLKGHLRKVAHAALDPAYVEPPPADPVPGALLYGRALPGLGDAPRRSPQALSLGHAKARSGFALLSTFDHDGRRYGLTTELAVLPLDRTRVIKPSAFHGITLGDDAALPVAFVKSRHAHRYVPGPHGGLVRGEPIAFREAVPIAGREKRIGGETWLEARDGTYLRADQATRLDPPHAMPAWAASGRRWIDVSILKQSLVAYEGKKPVYATLVSTGADGLGDPKKTHSTIQGVFLIHTKHLSVTMDDDKAGDEFDFRDVPFVQYFTEGFALHGAYWHDEFGTPRSHGCVNLAPKDAAWLFNWTGPEVPPAWHAALSLKRGTLVYTHP